MTAAPGPWTVVVPVKHLAAAKTRLRVGVADLADRLALAFAEDTVRAAAGAGTVVAVVVVTDDVRVRERVSGLARCVADPGGGLDAAVRAGTAEVGRGPCAVLLGDHPALRPEELDAALRAAGGHRLALVPDTEGTGTALLTAQEASSLVPRFGSGSAQRHRSAGHVLLAGGPGLRQDVDTPADLEVAVRLGVGPATRAVLGGPGAGAPDGAHDATVDDAGAPAARST